jgi:antitoxin component HigA of HigAB toxin-antitoxin module
VREKSGSDPIKTEPQYRRYLKELQRLVPLDPHPRTAEGARLELLARLIEDYEKARFKFFTPAGQRAKKKRPQSGV